MRQEQPPQNWGQQMPVETPNPMPMPRREQAPVAAKVPMEDLSEAEILKKIQEILVKKRAI